MTRSACAQVVRQQPQFHLALPASHGRHARGAPPLVDTRHATTHPYLCSAAERRRQLVDDMLVSAAGPASQRGQKQHPACKCPAENIVLALE